MNRKDKLKKIAREAKLEKILKQSEDVNFAEDDYASSFFDWVVDNTSIDSLDNLLIKLDQDD